jgi:hypothetical protein
LIEGNTRFEGVPDLQDLPEAVRMKGGKGWETEEESKMDLKKLEAAAKKAKRNGLMYSGISM